MKAAIVLGSKTIFRGFISFTVSVIFPKFEPEGQWHDSTFDVCMICPPYKQGNPLY